MLNTITTEQSFYGIITNNNLYVDKTKQIFELITTQKSIFLNKPRRFGKSMLISTLFEIFSGNKDLFKDLYIGQTNYSFEEFPIIYVSLSSFDIKNNDRIDDYLAKNIRISYQGKQYKILDFSDYIISLGELVEILYNHFGKKVVLLVDEYDKIATANFKDQSNIDRYIGVLSSLYSGIKDANGMGYMRFTFISGLTKILSNNLMSTLNHLLDISDDYTYYDICGYTKQEIVDNFYQHDSDYLPLLANRNNNNIEFELYKIKQFYNGYNFGNEQDLIYNPYSINLLFQKQKYDLYWANTGRAQLVLDYISDLNTNEYLQFLDGLQNQKYRAMGTTELFSLNKGELNIIGLLYQVGYLTIIDGFFKIPNKETEFCLVEDFSRITFNYNHEILGIYKNTGYSFINGLLSKDERIFQEGITGLERMLMFINPKWYQSNPEGQLKGYLYNSILISGLNQYMSMSQEEITNDGFADIVIKDDKSKICIIIEAKGSESLKKAIPQIENQYLDFYRNEGYKIVMVGIKWDAKKGKITHTINYDYI